METAVEADLVEVMPAAVVKPAPASPDTDIVDGAANLL